MSRTRAAVGTALIVLLLATAAGYAVWRRTELAGAQAGFDLARPDTVFLVGAGSRVEQRDADGDLVGRGPVCQRQYVAHATLVCLRSTGTPFSSELTVFRGDLGEPDVRLDLWGNPSRARVSPSGRYVAWTVFRSGDSYAKAGQFSTTAGFYDLRTGAHHGSLEDFTVEKDGAVYRADDVNFWGITFAPDDRTFYATLGSAGTTWLLRGAVGSTRLTTVRENVECPSISPDGTRIAYKYRTGRAWEAHVLDLGSGRDVTIPETRGIDDQIAWLDNETLAFGRHVGGVPAIVTAPADGARSPQVHLRGSSPSPS